MPLERSAILQDALGSMQGLSLDISDKSTKCSLFGVLRSVLESAASHQTPENDVLKHHRMALECICAIRNNMFMGVKTHDIRQAVAVLFSEGKELLPHPLFGNYTHRDLLAYTELCRRIFMTGRSFDVVQSTNKARPPASQGFKPPSWTLSGVGVLTIQKALSEGNAGCARYVLNHINDRNNTKAFIQRATEIINGDK